MSQEVCTRSTKLEGRSKHTQSLEHSFKKVSVSHAQLAHFSTLAKEKHMLLILNFSTLTFITNARTTMPFAWWTNSAMKNGKAMGSMVALADECITSGMQPFL